PIAPGNEALRRPIARYRARYQRYQGELSMKRWIIVLAATLAVFAVTAGAAFAADPVQSATQSSSTDQNAVAASSATQIEPSNQNISVRVLSPGNDGAVDQSNEATSNATATNNATTTQTANQTQSSNCGCVPW